MMDTQAVQHIMDYNFRHEGELGKNLKRFNGATRVDLLRDPIKSPLRTPIDLLFLLKFLADTYRLNLSYGLKLQRHMVHFVLERPGHKIGIFFLDQKRVVSMKQVYLVEKAISIFSLNQGIIISNNYSIPALRAISRVNSFNPIVKTLYMNSVLKMTMIN